MSTVAQSDSVEAVPLRAVVCYAPWPRVHLDGQHKASAVVQPLMLGPGCWRSFGIILLFLNPSEPLALSWRGLWEVQWDIRTETRAADED